MAAKDESREPQSLREAEIAALEELLALRRKQEAAKPTAAKYLDDPLGFIDHCIIFPERRVRPGEKPVRSRLAPYQREIIASIPALKRVAVRGPHGLGKCLIKSDVIRLADGSLVPAEQLVGQKFKVLAVDPVTGRITPALAFASDNGIKDVVRIVTDKGREITRTLNHPLWGDAVPKSHPSPQGRGRMRPEPAWVLAGDLVPGSVIAVYLGNAGASVSPSRAEVCVLAGLLTDGGLTGKAVMFSQAPGPMLDDFREAVAELGGRLWHRGGVDYVAGPAIKRDHRSHPIRALTVRWGISGHSAWTKRMPPEVWTWDDKNLALLLNRMFACDGWAHSALRPRNRMNREIGYCTVSTGLAQDVQRALLRLGIQAERRRKRTTWTHKGEHRTGTAWTVAVHDVRNIRLFTDTIGILGKEDAVSAVADSCDAAGWVQQQRWQYRNLPPGFAWEQVRTAERLEPQPTVAITVPGHETFLSDFVEHNTALAALVVLWFSLTREMAGIDWKIMTTAGSWTQLKTFLWPEIHKWANCVRWDTVGRGQFSERTELQQHHIRLARGLAAAASPDKPERMEGLHGDSVLWLYDEAKLLGPGTFESAEGAFAAAGEDSSLEAFALAISTPGECAGPFYSMHHRSPEWEDWHPRHVTKDEAIAAGRMSQAWADQRKKLWGENSAVYQNRVLGEFCSTDEDAIVPLSWAEAAIERWREWDAAGRPDPGDTHVIGLDVSATGPDKSAAAIRWGNVITEVRSWGKEDTMQTTGRLSVMLQGDPLATAMIDVIGVGAGVYDRGRELGLKVEPFDVRKKTTRRDATGQFGFARLRDAAWFHLREMLDPSRGAVLALPPDDELLGDLTALHFAHMSDGKVKVEEKAEMRKRLGRSPDKGDALIAACWAGQGSFLDAYGVIRCPNEKCPRGTFYGKDERGDLRTHCPHCREPLDVPDDDEAAA